MKAQSYINERQQRTYHRLKFRNKKKECLINSMHEFDDINDVKKNSDNYKRCKDQAKQEYY